MKDFGSFICSNQQTLLVKLVPNKPFVAVLTSLILSVTVCMFPSSKSPSWCLILIVGIDNYASERSRSARNAVQLCFARPAKGKAPDALRSRYFGYIFGFIQRFPHSNLWKRTSSEKRRRLKTLQVNTCKNFLLSACVQFSFLIFPRMQNVFHLLVLGSRLVSKGEKGARPFLFYVSCELLRVIKDYCLTV